MAELSKTAIAAALEALVAERKAYQRILEHSRSQYELAASGNSEGLLSALAERQRLADEVALIAEGTRDLKVGWDAASPQMSQAERVLASTAIAEIKDLLSRIIKQDDECSKLLDNRKGNILEEMLRLQKGRRVNQAYGRKQQGAPKFKDEEK